MGNDFETKSAVLRYRDHLRVEEQTLVLINYDHSSYPTTLFHKSRTLGADVNVIGSGCTLTTVPVSRLRWDCVEWTIDIRNGSTTESCRQHIVKTRYQNQV